MLEILKHDSLGLKVQEKHIENIEVRHCDAYPSTRKTYST
jgi:hypothetical protein